MILASCCGSLTLTVNDALGDFVTRGIDARTEPFNINMRLKLKWEKIGKEMICIMLIRPRQ